MIYLICFINTLLFSSGSLKLFNLTNNTFTGSIPAQVGLLQGASILLKGNLFNNASRPAPLSLCALRNVKEFDLKDDPKLCPPERNALNDFFDKAKGGDWLDGSMWLDEYESYCSWKGVTCDEMDHVMKLRLPTNGLSGILSESISNLTYLEELDLSNNDMKVIGVCLFSPSLRHLSKTFLTFLDSSQSST